MMGTRQFLCSVTERPCVCDDGPCVHARHGKKPNPGSQAAFHNGCKCPRIDNGWGKGIGGGCDAYGQKGPVFYINGNCPIHGRIPL